MDAVTLAWCNQKLGTKGKPLASMHVHIPPGADKSIVVMDEMNLFMNTSFSAALWYLCRRRSKSRQKSEEEGSEKRDPEDAGDSEAEAGSHPGFFGRLKRKRSTYAVKADATPGGQKQGQKGQQPVERAIQPSKSSRSKALVAGLLPQTWRSKPETPSDPSTPSGTPTSALSDSAAKAAHKYKFGTGESLGARFARSVPGAPLPLPPTTPPHEEDQNIDSISENNTRLIFAAWACEHDLIKITMFCNCLQAL